MRTFEGKEHFKLCSANRSCSKKKKSLRGFKHILTEKSWSHLSPYVFPFLSLYLAIMPWHTGRPTSQEWESPILCIREYLTGPEPSGGPGRGTAHQTWSLDVVTSRNEWQTPRGIPSSLFFLHLSLPCNHPPRKLCVPIRGGWSGESRESLCLDPLCIIWTYVLWKRALLKIPRKDFRPETTLLMPTNATFAAGGGSLCNLTLSERCRQTKIPNK